MAAVMAALAQVGGDMSRNGLIILDGPDASGKSTLAGAFKQVYNAEIIHLTWDEELKDKMWEYQTDKMLEACELSQERLVIIDRHWMSENIYANVFRGGSPWPLMGRMMDRVFMKHAAIYVICVHHAIAWAMDFHKKNIDPTHPYDDERFRELVVRYQRLGVGCKKRFKDEDYATWYTRQGGMARCRPDDVRMYHVDREGQYMGIKLSMLMEQLRRRRNTQYQPALNFEDHNILGHVQDAEYLIVGDTFNPKGNENYSYPFYEYGNSSLYLAQAMQLANLHEDRFMWTNAHDIDGVPSEHIKPLAACGLKVIPMGNMAEAVCLEQGITPYAKIYHPAHAKRFIDPEPISYARALEVL